VFPTRPGSRITPSTFPPENKAIPLEVEAVVAGPESRLFMAIALPCGLGLKLSESEVRQGKGDRLLLFRQGNDRCFFRSVGIYCRRSARRPR
jgi:hypothetical protein